jgi:hypothetical protein
MFGISSVKSLNVQAENPGAVWFDKTELGKIAVSIPQAEITGKATVNEHWPTHEMS